MKRQRGRGRKPGNPANRTYESNGPEVKIRGNASQIYDKYLQLARDATSSGDRVRAENLYQHAEHYYRIIQANQPKREPNAEEAEENAEATGDSVEGEEQTAREPREPRRGRRGRRSSEPAQDAGSEQSDDAAEDPLNVVTPEGDTGSAEASGETAGDESETPRRRTRRPRRSRSEKAAPEAGAETADAAETAPASEESSDSESEAA